MRPAVDQDRWRAALVSEIAAAAALAPGRRVDTVFFGGGTPSLMPPETVGAALDAIRSGWMLAPGAEITLEANPTSAEAAKFAGFRDRGVNRLSLGVQALSDPDLRGLGRMHDAAEALRALALARETFPRVSFDLIYARQNQTAADWRAELAQALALGPDHLSLYQLTIEDGTRFGDLARRGRLRGLPDTDLAAELFETTREICAAAGLPAYEVSNHARPGAESRHNLVYWRYGDFAGIGPGAHGRLTLQGIRWATETLHAPEAWLAAVEARPGSATRRSAVAPGDQAVEMLLMGLRLSEGVRPERFAALAGRPLAMEPLDTLAGEGLIEIVDGRLRATDDGRLLLNQVIATLAP